MTSTDNADRIAEAPGRRRLTVTEAQWRTMQQASGAADHCPQRHAAGVALTNRRRSPNGCGLDVNDDGTQTLTLQSARVAAWLADAIETHPTAAHWLAANRRPTRSGMSDAEAQAILDVDPTALADAIRAADPVPDPPHQPATWTAEVTYPDGTRELHVGLR